MSRDGEPVFLSTEHTHHRHAPLTVDTLNHQLMAASGTKRTRLDFGLMSDMRAKADIRRRPKTSRFFAPVNEEKAAFFALPVLTISSKLTSNRRGARISTHLLLDVAAGVLLIASPRLFGFSGRVF
jgi:hypothetical protein